MADFIYQEPFPVGEDKTKYRLLTKEYVKVVECDGRKILKVDPKGLELLSKEAYADVSFYLRAAHLQKLRNILEDPEATDNDKFVAYTMLLNQTVSAEGGHRHGHLHRPQGRGCLDGGRRRRVHRPGRLRDLQGP